MPDSRRRSPAAVADLADSLWQTALTLATDAAHGTDVALSEHLAQLRADVDVRSHALAQREIEIDTQLRSRERTIRELEEHLRATMSMANQRDATIQSLEARLAAALAETETYRQRLATVVARAMSRHQALEGAPRKRPTQTKAAARPRRTAKARGKKAKTGTTALRNVTPRRRR